MPDYKAPLRDMRFLIDHVFDFHGHYAALGASDASPDMVGAILEEGAKFCENVLAPLNRSGDEEGCHFDNGVVTTPKGFKEAFAQYVEGGWHGLAADPAYGGQGLPMSLGLVLAEMISSSNTSWGMYPGLTHGAMSAIRAHGTEEQKNTYLSKLTAGQWTGTMCLTEARCGTDLGLIKTRAVPQADGSYAVTGSKIFISAGEHDMSDNIIHLVLAKLPDAPAGVKGISLFIVPKFLVNDDGSLGKRNDVLLAGLFHKMGWRGTTSTALNFGDNGECVGYLVGQPHQGLSCMFQMMNEARIGVGMGAVMLGYAGYLYSLEYARERPQGRLPDSKDPNTAPVSIIQHADIKRMLLTQKAYVEGAFDLGLYAARLFDDTTTLETEAARKQAHELLDLLTPIVKSWPSEFCLKANELAIQILGGHGYTREYPVEQYYRDNRLNPIHEGTHGIQSLDLLGRKLAQNGGAGLKQLIRLIAETGARAQEYPSLTALREPLEQLVARLQEVTLGLLTDLAQGKVNSSLANSALYLKVFGHTVIGWRWLEQAIRAEEGLARGNAADVAFYKGKLQAARYFLTWEIPGCHHELAILEARDDTCLGMQDEWF